MLTLCFSDNSELYPFIPYHDQATLFMMDSDSSDNSLTDGDIDLDIEEDVEEDAGEVDQERKSCALQVSSKPVRKAFPMSKSFARVITTKRA